METIRRSDSRLDPGPRISPRDDNFFPGTGRGRPWNNRAERGDMLGRLVARLTDFGALMPLGRAPSHDLASQADDRTKSP